MPIDPCQCSINRILFGVMPSQDSEESVLMHSIQSHRNTQLGTTGHDKGLGAGSADV